VICKSSLAIAGRRANKYSIVQLQTPPQSGSYRRLDCDIPSHKLVGVVKSRSGNSCYDFAAAVGVSGVKSQRTSTYSVKKKAKAAPDNTLKRALNIR